MGYLEVRKSPPAFTLKSLKEQKTSLEKHEATCPLGSPSRFAQALGLSKDSFCVTKVLCYFCSAASGSIAGTSGLAVGISG